MKARVKITPFWDLYMIKRKNWESTHSNRDTLIMLEAFGVYKGLGGKKSFDIDNMEFVTPKAKEKAKILYNQYIDMISDYIFYYDKIYRDDFSYKNQAREMCAKKYKSLTMLHKDKTDACQIKEVIAKFMSNILNESQEYMINILDESEKIYQTCV